MTNLNYVLDHLPYFDDTMSLVKAWGNIDRVKRLCIVAAVGRVKPEELVGKRELLDEAARLVVFSGYRNEKYLPHCYDLPGDLDREKTARIGRHYDYDGQCQFYSIHCPFKDEEVCK